MNAVAEIERLFMPLLHEAEQRCFAMYPDFVFNVWSSSTGGLTSYQGHDVGLECIFPDAADHEANCVALIIGVMHLTTEPLLCDASVGWSGGYSPEISVDLLATPVPLTPESLSEIVIRFPELLATFEQSLSAWLTRQCDA